MIPLKKVDLPPEISRVFFAVCYGKKRVLEIVKLLGKKRTAVSNLINKLYRLGMLNKQKIGRNVLYTVNWGNFHKIIFFDILMRCTILLKPFITEEQVKRILQKIFAKGMIRKFFEELSVSMFEYKDFNQKLREKKAINKVYKAYFKNYTILRAIQTFFVSLFQITKNRRYFTKQDRKCLEAIKDCYSLPTALEELIISEILRQEKVLKNKQ